jgi:hypothetical protein
VLHSKHIIFWFVFFSTMASFYAEIFQRYDANKLPDLILVAVFFGLIISGKIKLSRRILYGALPFFIVLSIVFFYNAYYARLTTGGSGIVGLFVITFIYICILNNNQAPLQVYSLGRQISILYAIHIMYLFIETIVLANQSYGFMKAMIPSYRNLLGQPIYQLIGIKSWGAANGLMVGPQVASQLTALSIIWFAPIYKRSPISIKGFPKNFLWILSLVLYPLCMTGTSLLMLFIMICMILLLYPKNILIRGFFLIKILTISAIVMSLLSGVLLDILLYRLNPHEGPDYTSFYLMIFLDPVYAFFDLPLENKLFGLQDSNTGLKYTDFGLAAIVWKGGLLLSVAAICTFFVIITRTLLVFKYRIKEDCSLALAWSTLAMSSAVISIGWFVSLVHYTVAVENGGKQLFAFSIAVTVLSLMRIDSIRLKDKKKPMIR